MNQLTELRMMSKAWAEKNNSTSPKDIKTQDENFAHRNANGTGPFVLKESPLQNLCNPHKCWCFGVITDIHNSRFEFQ